MGDKELKIGQVWKIGFADPFYDGMYAEIMDLKYGRGGLYVKYKNYFGWFDKLLLPSVHSDSEEYFRMIYKVFVK